VAEYIMAHAWYHYPMYDEAMLRLSGVTEMSIIRRCADCQIALKEYDGQGQLIERTFHDLICELHKKEPGKQLKFSLDWIRELRNQLVHPKKFGFAGMMIHTSVQEVVNIINKLFLPEELLLSYFEQRKKMASQLKPFLTGAWELVHDGRLWLVEKCKVSMSIRSGNEWHYLLVLYPVYKDFTQALKSKSFMPVLCFDVTHIKTGKIFFEAINTLTGEPVRLTQVRQPGFKEVYDKHRAEWKRAEKFEQVIYNSMKSDEIEFRESELYYKYLVNVIQ
jgi:hypothetical protein